MPVFSTALSSRPELAHAFSLARPRPETDWAGVAAMTGLPGTGVARAIQVHGATALWVTQAGPAGEADALITDRRGLLVSVVTADCVPVLVAAGDAVAAIHAGWRGVANGIIPATLAMLAGRGPLTAAVGPCIRPDVYETGDEVIHAIVAAGVPEAVVAHRGPGKAHSDIAAAAAWQLRAAGCAVVEDAGACTFQDHRFASYRRQGPLAGRQVSVIGLRP